VVAQRDCRNRKGTSCLHVIWVDGRFERILCERAAMSNTNAISTNEKSFTDAIVDSSLQSSSTVPGSTSNAGVLKMVSGIFAVGSSLQLCDDIT